MPVTDILRRNAREHGDEVALIELNPTMEDTRKISFKEFDLVQQTSARPYRRQITWKIFDEKSNRVANMLLDRGIKKGDRVAILMFNCLEWLPIYFGILKTGAIAVPFNFRYTANEISYCADLADVSVLIFGEEFVDRLTINADELAKNRLLIYVGEGQAPEFAESYWHMVADYSSEDVDIELTNEDLAAIYFSSGTTGYPSSAPLALSGSRDGSRTPRDYQGRLLPLHSASLSYRREIPLDGFPLDLQQSSAPQGYKA